MKGVGGLFIENPPLLLRLDFDLGFLLGFNLIGLN